MAKALLIGNGPSALEHKIGERIDSNEFDIVCRINRGHKQDDGTLNTGFEKYVGTRCDYWIISDLRSNLAINRKDEYKKIFIYTPKFKINKNIVGHCISLNQHYNNIECISSEYEDNINKIIDFKPQWPSTGIISIHFITSLFKEVYLYGFDTYNTKYDNSHYFEDRPNKYKNKNNQDHAPSLEKDYIEYMI